MKGYIRAVVPFVSVVVCACGGELVESDVILATDVLSDAGDVVVADNSVASDVDETVDSSPDICIPYCPDWAECGDDGCGGSCGTCWWDKSCREMKCVDDVPPGCDGRECGYSLDGDYCGDCGDGLECLDGSCGFVDYPNCDGRECGDDGIGGLCGQCDQGMVCNFAGMCQPDCEYPMDLPSTWGLVTVVDSFTIPNSVEEMSVCFDYTGNGVPENNLSGMATQIENGLQEIGSWTTSMAINFKPVPAIIADPGMIIEGLRVRHDDGGEPGSFLVQPESYNPARCRPFITFDDVSVSEGDIDAKAAELTLHINISPSFVLPVRLIDAHMSGMMVPDGEGLQISDGVISAVALREDLSQAVDELWAECQKDPRPEDLADVCESLEMAMAPPPRIVGPGILMQLHRTADGTYLDKDSEHPGNAMAVCLTFTAKPTTITGYFNP